MHCFLSMSHSRVSDYGFNKLIELFEAVPGTVEVTEDPDGERLLQLTDSERLSVVAEQIATLVKNSRRQGCDIFTAYGTSDPLHERFCKFPISSTNKPKQLKDNILQLEVWKVSCRSSVRV